MGLNDVIPGGIDLGALRRLVGAPEEADGVKNLDELLELMAKVARGDSEYGAVQLSPQGCRELLDRVANAQQLATVANQGKEQAWRERDDYLAKLSEVAAARDREQARAGVAERERNDLAERLADLSELVLDDADASAASADGEPPRHLHCCECEQCQPPQRGVVIINIFRAEGHCPTINVGGKGD